MKCIVIALNLLAIAGTVVGEDLRNIRTGFEIPSEGYADQPYVVITMDGNWLCTLTTGAGKEGEPGQHVVATISADQGRTWSPLIDIEPVDGPEASWVVPFVAPYGRVYAFYSYNGDRLPPRADMLGWYVYKYSDDHGRTWSTERHRLPVRVTAADRGNDWQGEVQIFWGIHRPIVSGDSVYFSFTKLGKYMLDLGEGWLFRSDNLLTERDPAKIHWELLPEGEHGIRSPELGSIQEEHNLSALEGGGLFCMYRTTQGFPASSYSRDGGRNWSVPEAAVYSPGGRAFKNPRACPMVWRTQNGRYLFWFHHHGGTDFTQRNPVWISGGIKKDGYIYWSQPEILLYDPDPKTRISYPGLLELEGRYFFSETQKEMARIHEVAPTLIEGLWRQGDDRKTPETGLLLSRIDPERLNETLAAPTWPDLSAGGGFSISMLLHFDDIASKCVLLDTRDASGRGVALESTGEGTVRLLLNDGGHSAAWDTDPGLLAAGCAHHLTFIVDGGPKIISVLVDGVLCDGGATRTHGWMRFPDELGDVNASPEMRLLPEGCAKLEAIWIYDRHLRTSEAVALYHAATS